MHTCDCRSTIFRSLFVAAVLAGTILENSERNNTFIKLGIELNDLHIQCFLNQQASPACNVQFSLFETVTK